VPISVVCEAGTRPSMTAASTTSRAFAPPARTILRWQRCLAVLGLCLPVPVSAASGLSLPLPTTVERLATSLVPWIDAVALHGNEALPVGVSGRIFAGAADPTSDSGAGGLTTDARVGEPAHTAARPRPAETTPTRGGATTTAAAAAPQPTGEQTRDESGHSEPRAGGDSAPNAPQPPAEPAQGPSKPAPAEPDPSQPAPEPEPDPTDPIEPVVEQATAPVEPVVETVEETAEETLAPVTSTLKGLGG